jgi:thiol-disulfide isomerase/thioredoxin
MAPVVNGLKDDYDGSVAIRIYNVGTSSAGNALADKYGVQYVPTFVFVDSDGEYVDMIIGETSEATLRKALDSLD